MQLFLQAKKESENENNTRQSEKKSCYASTRNKAAIPRQLRGDNLLGGKILRVAATWRYDRCINGAGSAPIKVARPRHSWNNWIGFCSCESRPSTIGGTRPFSTHATRLFRARYHGSLGFTIFSSKDATFSHREYPTWSHSIVCFIFCSTIF